MEAIIEVNKAAGKTVLDVANQGKSNAQLSSQVVDVSFPLLLRTSLNNRLSCLPKQSIETLKTQNKAHGDHNKGMEIVQVDDWGMLLGTITGLASHSSSISTIYSAFCYETEREIVLNE